MKVDKRVQRNTESFNALCGLLKEVIRNPAPYGRDGTLREALRSQGSLAKFESSTLGIVASSLNTMKRIAERGSIGGYADLDLLRIRAQEAIEKEAAKTNRPKRNTKSELEKRISELKQERLRLQEDLLLLTYVLEKSLTQARNYASQASDPAILIRCKREQRDLLDMLSSAESSIDRSNMAHLRHEKD